MMLTVNKIIRNNKAILPLFLVVFGFMAVWSTFASNAFAQEQMNPSIRLHHGAISVNDMDESIAFYSKVLGFVVDTEFDVNEDFKIVHMRIDDFYIELFWLKEHKELPESSRALDTDLAVMGTKHIAFETGDIEGMYEMLISKGVEMAGEIRLDNPYYKYFFFKDPNKILLEIVQRRDTP